MFWHGAKHWHTTTETTRHTQSAGGGQQVSKNVCVFRFRTCRAQVFDIGTAQKECKQQNATMAQTRTTIEISLTKFILITLLYHSASFFTCFLFGRIHWGGMQKTPFLPPPVVVPFFHLLPAGGIAASLFISLLSFSLVVDLWTFCSIRQMWNVMETLWGLTLNSAAAVHATGLTIS